MSNPSNLSANPRFSILSFAQENSPRGEYLFSSAMWDVDSSPVLLLQPPANIGNGEIFFVKEVHLLIKKSASLGNNKFMIYHQGSCPSVIMKVDTVIELHNHFDVDPASPLQDPQFPTDATKTYNKLLLVFHTPLKVRSSTSDFFEVKLTDSVGSTVLSGLGAGNGEMHISVSGWKIKEASY